MEPIQNIYEDEQKKLDDSVRTEMELTFRINDLLHDYGYVMEPALVNGVPEIKFTKA